MTTKKVSPFVPITLGTLSAFGPFVTDFYLPVMPEMSKYFNTSTALVSASLTMSMIGLAGGQILIGPLTDKYGRKQILLGSLLLFIVSTVLMLFSKDIHFLNLMRLFQGFGGAGGIVIAKSMATDLYTGDDLVKFMALLGAIGGVAPVAAPVLGGLMSYVTNWKGLFTVLLALGVVLFICSCFLKETLKPELRDKRKVMSVYANLFKVLKNPVFLTSTLSIMFAMFTFFAYISSSSFIIEQSYGLSALVYSICLGLNAIMISVGCAVSAKFKDMTKCLKIAGIGVFVAVILIAACLLTNQGIVLLMCSYLIFMLFYGMLQAITNATALDSERDNAGAASAIFGAGGFVAGAIASPLVGLGELHFSTSMTMLAGGLLCMIFTFMMIPALKKAKAE